MFDGQNAKVQRGGSKLMPGGINVKMQSCGSKIMFNGANTKMQMNTATKRPQVSVSHALVLPRVRGRRLLIIHRKHAYMRIHIIYTQAHQPWVTLSIAFVAFVVDTAFSTDAITACVY